MPLFRLAEEALSGEFSAIDVVSNRAELIRSIRRSVVNLRDLSESDLSIRRACGRGVRNGALSYAVVVQNHGLVGFLDRSL